MIDRTYLTHFHSLHLYWVNYRIYRVSSELLPYSHSYVCIIESFNLSQLLFMTVLLGNIPYLYDKFSFFPGSSLVRTYFCMFNFIFKSIIMVLY